MNAFCLMDYDAKTTVNVRDFRDMIMSVMGEITPDTLVRLSLSRVGVMGRLLVHNKSLSPQDGWLNDTRQMRCKVVGKPFVASANCMLLCAALDAMTSSEVVLKFSTIDIKPILILQSPDNHQYTLMSLETETTTREELEEAARYNREQGVMTRVLAEFYDGFVGVDFSDVNMSMSTFNGAVFDRANLSNANLEGVVAINTTMRGANLSGANLRGASLECVDLADANLEGAIADDTTVWPWLFDPVGAGVVMIREE